MKCHHCQTSFHPDPKNYPLGSHGRNEKWKYVWEATVLTCPACVKPMVFVSYKQDYGSTQFRGEAMVAFPQESSKPPAPQAVPSAIAQDFNEASAVLSISPQASAALSRRCLQHILTERGISKSDNLSKAIDAALASGLPSHLADNLDAIRNIGNFAAHPQKAESSGKIVPVEPEEAEWNLDVLELLFDFYYVQPAIAASRRAALNEKLSAAGKKQMKEPPNGATSQVTPSK